MYESHYGLSGPPFQLNPDPNFYFDSKGHSNALAYLKFGVYQGEGFIVVTGEIGAGKTTLVRTLLSGLNSEQVVAAQVVSTQLESGDLLRAIITAFGISPTGPSKAHLIATLEAFLTALAAKGRRALLVVDEAQNLSLEAIEELRMLSNFQLGKHALLQSFLVGQPELRRLLESSAMEQFRQRVIASCHLGPLDALETRAYIEHRLHRVGWTGRPAIEEGAFEEIHGCTSGIPRRINLLSNRLLLRAYLSNEDVIRVSDVLETSREMRGEVGEPAFVATPVRPIASGEPPGGASSRNASVDADRSPATVVRRLHFPGGRVPEHPVFCVVDSRSGYMKAAALAEAFAQHPQSPPLIAVNPGSLDAVALEQDVKGIMPPPLDVHLGVENDRYPQSAAQVMLQFDELLREFSPRAVLVCGNGVGVLHCALAASGLGIPVARLEGGQREAHSPVGERNSVLIDRLADLIYTTRLTAHYTLYREGVPSQRVHCCGGLVDNVMHRLAPHAQQAISQSPLLVAAPQVLRHAGGILLVTALVPRGSMSGKRLEALVLMMRVLSKQSAVVWAVTAETLATLKGERLDKRLRDADVLLYPDLGYLEGLGLLEQARCLVTGTEGRVSEEAAALGVPVIGLTGEAGVHASANEESGLPLESDLGRLQQTLQEILMRERPPAEEPAYWNGGPAAQLASHFLEWLPRRLASERNAPMPAAS